MRTLKMLIVVLAAAVFVRAEDITPRFVRGITISYTPPDAKVWKLAERDEQEAVGMIMYKREAIIDEKGLSVEPCLSIVYRKLPQQIKDAIEFVVASRTSLPYEINQISPVGDKALVLSFKHSVGGCEHTTSIAHLFEVGLGVQAISETTTSVLKAVAADQDAFFRSISIKKK